MDLEEGQLSAIERAKAARKTSTVPAGRCSSRDIADYYGINIACVSEAAKRGEIPGAHKVLNRWVFDDFRVVADGWTPPLVERIDKGLSPVGGRRADGPFAKGNTFAVGLRKTGRPTRVVEKRFLTTLVNEVKEEDWVGIIRKAVDQALQGDHRARLWLSHYLIGKPVERILAKVDTAGERFSVAERAVAVEELLGFLTHRDEEENIIDVTPKEAVSVGTDATPG